ncbi:uncharacterized protein N7473_012527 [Penicillium subrubescens]|uniref:uncharacterized protein n=1 Tax=Penicillium subrubescens TaxID=1316194 RepID=UPI002545358A|nr:uncharacterized protein N7473_012527 [Penicillium subrubescens]KAJ5875180.1 hypothetical protein N7473_012527 [Penicillium subrubescens]
MTSQPKDSGHKVLGDKVSLETLRICLPDSCPNIGTYLEEKGLSKIVRETVPLENTACRPEGWILVDLAVEREGIPLVQGCFSSVSSSLDDLSLVIIDEDSSDPETQKWLRFFWVHSNYLRQNAVAKESGRASARVLEWYQMRLDKLSMVLMQNRA